MKIYLAAGRVFLGVALIGIGVLHFVFPGIRPLIWPELNSLPAKLQWTRYVIAGLLSVSGVLICTQKRVKALALFWGVAFLLLFLFGHLPAFLAVHGTAKLKYWTNLNKVLALSGGFFILSAIQAKQNEPTKFNKLIAQLWWPGSYCFACMLFLFGLGHLLSPTALSAMVPAYIPFKIFWTVAAGILLVGSAVSIITRFKIRQIVFVLAVVLFVWLVTLHIYYAVRFPGWQEGEHFIGSLTCLAFCGTSLLLSKSR